jgi:hypothetical protein
MDAYANHGRKKLEEVSSMCLNNDAVKLVTVSDLIAEVSPYDLRYDTLKFFFKIVHIQAGTKFTDKYGATTKKNSKQGERIGKVESYAYFILGRCVFSNLPFVSFIETSDCSKVFNTPGQQWEGEAMGTNEPKYLSQWLNLPVLKLSKMFIPVDYFSIKRNLQSLMTGTRKMIVSDHGIDRNEEKKSFQTFFAENVDIEIESAELEYSCQNSGCNGSHEVRGICSAPGRKSICSLKFCLVGNLICVEKNLGEGGQFRMRSVTEYFFDRDTLESGNLNDLSMVQLRPLITRLISRYKELGCKWFYEGWFRTETVTENEKTSFFEGNLHITDLRLQYVDDSKSHTENNETLKHIMENVVGRYSSNVIRSGKDININVDIQQNPRLAKIMGLTFRRNVDDSFEILETDPKIIENGILRKSSKFPEMTGEDARNENLQHSSTSPKIKRNSTERVGQSANEIETIPAAWQNAFSLWGPIESSSPEPIDHEEDQFYPDGSNRYFPESPIVESNAEIPCKNDEFVENAKRNGETLEMGENVRRSRKKVVRGKRDKKNLRVINLKRKFKGYSRSRNRKCRSISDDIENRPRSTKADDTKVNEKTDDERNSLRGNLSPSLSSSDGEKTRRRDRDEDDADSDDDNGGGGDDQPKSQRVVSNNHTSTGSKQRKTQINYASVGASISSRTRRSKCLAIPEKELDTNSNGSSTRWTVTSNHNKQKSLSAGRKSSSRASIQNHVAVETGEEENRYDDRMQEQPHEEGIQEEQLLLFYDNSAPKRKKKNASSRNGKKAKCPKENSTNVQSDEQPDEEGNHTDQSYIPIPVEVKMELDSRTSSPAPSTVSSRSSIHSQSAYVSSVLRTQLTDNARLTV